MSTPEREAEAPGSGSTRSENVTSKIDMPSEALIRSVEAGRHRLVRRMIVGGAICALSLAMGIVKLWTRHDSAEAMSAAMLIGVPLVVSAFVVYSQRHAWTPRNMVQARTPGARDFIDALAAAVARAKTGRQESKP
jgi:hypothetical protein